MLCAVVAAWVAFSIWIYRRDGFRLPRPTAASLLMLRLLAIGVLVFFVLNPEKRSETQITQASRVAVMVDTSLSMGLADQIDRDDPNKTEPERRIDVVNQLFLENDLLTNLNEKHDVSVFRFGNANQLEVIADFPRRGPAVPSSNTTSNDKANSQADSAWSLSRWIALALLLFAFASFFVSPRSRSNHSSNQDGDSLSTSRFHPIYLLIGVVTFSVGLILLAYSDLSTLSDRADESPSTIASQPSATEEANASPENDISEFNWTEAIAPQGTSTKIGTALQQIVSHSKGSALAGIVLLSDGGQNDGLPINRAIAEVSDSNIPIFAIGIGNNQPFTNVRVSEVNAPARVTPNDPFNIDAIVQAFGMQNQVVQVQLLETIEGKEISKLLDEQSLTLNEDGRPASVSFEVPAQAVGTHQYQVRLVRPKNDLDETDNLREKTVQSIDRKTRVFLLAGGPSRDYQFLRNQLFRDDSIELNVLLQTASPGADQESDKMLFSFPEPQQLADYDCVVAFDPNWNQLSVQQATSLEQWVSNKAGGMIVIAGPVFTPEWTRAARGNEAIDRIRDLYPVSFFSQGSARLKLGRFGGEKPFPLKFSRAGRNARQLWLADSATDNLDRWQQFQGVYGYYAVNEAKAGADILAWFSDPSTMVDGDLPIYLASQYYGAGRVLFQASSEIWRLRSVDVEHFQRYYLNLIRWASQGRLLRDSNRGVLLLDRDRCWVGDQVVVRAILRDESDQPLMHEQIIATLQRPNGITESFPLINVQDAARPGTFTASIIASNEGDYQIALPIPGSTDQQTVLRTSVQANIPDLERVRPERNDALLLQLATQTAGHYFHSLTEAGLANWVTSNDSDGNNQANDQASPASIDLCGSEGLPKLIRSVDQETFLPGLPDERFAQRLARWLLLLLATFLCGEWVLRRLHRLA